MRTKGSLGAGSEYVDSRAAVPDTDSTIRLAERVTDEA